jgi:hypothetical protein
VATDHPSVVTILLQFVVITCYWGLGRLPQLEHAVAGQEDPRHVRLLHLHRRRLMGIRRRICEEPDLVGDDRFPPPREFTHDR